MRVRAYRHQILALPITLKPTDISSALSGAASASATARNAAPTTTAIGVSSAAAPAAPSARPRPRPRPAYKGALAQPAAANEAAGNEASPAPAPIIPSTSGRDTTKQMNPPAAGLSSSSTMINPPTISANTTFAEDTSMYTLDIAERAKLRSRARSQKSNANPPPPIIDNDVIEISSDDDLNIRPPPKAAKAKQDVPSPRKRTKKTHTVLNSTIDDASSAIIPKIGRAHV